jgi:hypothetical protein
MMTRGCLWKGRKTISCARTRITVTAVGAVCVLGMCAGVGCIGDFPSLKDGGVADATTDRFDRPDAPTADGSTDSSNQDAPSRSDSPEDSAPGNDGSTLSPCVLDKSTLNHCLL